MRFAKYHFAYHNESLLRKKRRYLPIIVLSSTGLSIFISIVMLTDSVLFTTQGARYGVGRDTCDMRFHNNIQRDCDIDGRLGCDVSAVYEYNYNQINLRKNQQNAKCCYK